MWKLAALTALLSGSVEGLKCPNPKDIQDPKVAATFKMEHFLGTYYEIAYHDYTQPQKVCGCQRSVKTFKDNKIYDDFSLNCGNPDDLPHAKSYHNDLSFDLTEDTGVWTGKWPIPIIEKIGFVDTLVDFGPINEDG